jgi:hypothetical protein
VRRSGGFLYRKSFSFTSVQMFRLLFFNLILRLSSVSLLLSLFFSYSPFHLDLLIRLYSHFVAYLLNATLLLPGSCRGLTQSYTDRTINSVPLLLCMGRCLVTAGVSLSVPRSFLSNGSTCHNILKLLSLLLYFTFLSLLLIILLLLLLFLYMSFITA